MANFAIAGLDVLPCHAARKTSLSRHWARILGGSGRCVVGGVVWPAKQFDLVTILSWTWHRLRPTEGESPGFLGMVNMGRDMPVVVRFLNET